MILNWIFWGVPEKYARRYVVWLFMILLGIPYLLGFYYIKLGIIINLIWYDIIFYGYVRAKQKLGED